MKINKNYVNSVCYTSKRVNYQNGIKNSVILVKVLLIGFVISVVLFGPVSAQAQNTYCVRAGATGANNGSDWSNAYTSIPIPLRGATYYVADGAYGSYTFSTATSGTTPITIKKATVADHGTSTGWSDTYGDGQATFSGKVEFTSSYWFFDGVTGGGAGSWNKGFGFKIMEKGAANALIRVNYSGSANNITVRHVEMQGGGGSSVGGYYSNDGLAIYNSASNVTLSHAWMYDIGRCPVFITGAVNTIIEHVYVQSFNPIGGVHAEVMSTGQAAMGDLTWRYNLVTAIKSTGGLMWDNNTNTNCSFFVYGNVFYKPAGIAWDKANGIIGGWTGGNREQFKNVKVYNNTFINCDQETLSTFPNVYSGNIAYNNLWYNSNSPNFAKFGTHDYNHFINSGGNHSEANGTSATSGDPFVDYVNLDFRLKAPTNAGISLPSPYKLDPTGMNRGSDGTWDRGAFEFGGDNIQPPRNVILLP